MTHIFHGMVHMAASTLLLIHCTDEVNSIVVDVGSYTCKAGYGGEDTPKAVFPSVRRMQCILLRWSFGKSVCGTTHPTVCWPRARPSTTRRGNGGRCQRRARTKAAQAQRVCWLGCSQPSP